MGGEDKNLRKLYVGNLDPRVSSTTLRDFFADMGEVEECKVVKHKDTGLSAGYGFVDFVERATAEAAVSAKNHSVLFGREVRVNWAYQTSSCKDGADPQFHLFVGDLAPKIDDEALHHAFSAFGDCYDARVMCDPITQRQRGYGFVTFRNKEDAEKALQAMNGQDLDGRTIRVNWANQKTPHHRSLAQDEQRTQRTVYVGNLPLDATPDSLGERFGTFGEIEDVRLQTERGFAFVTFAQSSAAARAIECMNGELVGTKAIKCAWGRTRERDHTFQLSSSPPGPTHSVPLLMPPPFQPFPPPFSFPMPQYFAPEPQLGMVPEFSRPMFVPFQPPFPPVSFPPQMPMQPQPAFKRVYF